MKSVDVESTLIHSVRYDEAHRILEISFNDDGTYRYYEVPPEVVEELLDAESKGQYFTDHIRDTYLFTRIW